MGESCSSSGYADPVITKGTKKQTIDKSWTEFRIEFHIYMGEWRFCAFTDYQDFFLKIQTLNKVCWLFNTNSAVTQHLFAFANVFVQLYPDQDVPEKYPGIFPESSKYEKSFLQQCSYRDSWDVSPPTSKAVDHPSFYGFKLIVSAGYSF